MKKMKKEQKSESWLTFTAIFLFIILIVSGLIYLSCGPVPYVPCSAVQDSQTRCNGEVVELCDGEYWNPIMDCSQLTGPDGEPVPHDCSIAEGGATCQ